VGAEPAHPAFLDAAPKEALAIQVLLPSRALTSRKREYGHKSAFPED
jgi:hypothetical protein